MKREYRAPKVFSNSISNELSFLKAISISQHERTLLIEIRDLVRSKLRTGFKELKKSIGQDNESIKRYLTPVFKTQGSFSYKTLNDPAHRGQQIDLDDGVYFHMELLNGKPLAVKDELLNIVEGMLNELACEQGWTCVRKATCARLNVNERIHVDIPVYAIPEYKRASMEKAYNRNESMVLDSNREEKVRLDPSEIYLALWEGSDDWIQSDPLELEGWFKTEVAIHGEVMRKTCRYLKAWRDYHWPKGGPSSIALMVAVDQAFNDYQQTYHESLKDDCHALLEVVKRLPNIFAGNIKNPVSEAFLFPNGLDSTAVTDIRYKIAILSSTVTQAFCVKSNSPQGVISKITTAFGGRIPNRPEWVEVTKIAAVTAAITGSQPVYSEPSPNHRSA